jgi:nitroreductase
MDVQEAILTRRTIHLYQAQPVPKAALDAALLAATRAPNHRHTHPFRFTVVGPQTREELAEIGVACKSAKRALSEEAAAAVRAKITTPGALVVFRQALCKDPAVCEEDYATLACAAQNFMLSLHSQGIGSKWSTGGVTKHPDTYALLGIDPQAERIVGFLWAGYAATVPSPEKPALGPLVTRLD